MIDTDQSIDQTRADIRRRATNLTVRQMRNRAKDAVKQAKRALVAGDTARYVERTAAATEWRAIADQRTTPKPTTTLAQYLAGHTATRDGHRIWLGPINNNGNPICRHEDAHTTAVRVLWHQERGVWPDGHLTRDCDEPRCVDPEHHDDLRGRQRTRALLAAVTGLPGSRTATCKRGHLRADHTVLRPNGAPYCAACLRVRKAGAA